MNLTCLDQCHGVRSHATSFSLTQKEVLYSLNLIHECTSLFSPKVISAGLPGKTFPQKHAFVDISVFLWLRKQRPRFAQGQPKGYFQTKNFIERLKLLLKWMLIERWRRATMLSSMCQHVARLQFDCCAEKDSLCGTVMMAWIWHVWINSIVFVPTAKAPPKAGAKELSYNSLNLAYSGQHPRFGPNWFVQNRVCLEKLSHGNRQR